MKVRTWVLLAVVVLLWCAPRAIGAAELMIVQRTTSEGFAGIGMSFEGDDTTYYTADMCSKWNKIHYHGGIAGGLMPDVNNTTITRLDKEVIWTLKPKDKEYTEQPLLEQKKQMEKARKDLKEKQDEKDDNIEYSFRVDVKRDGQKKNIAGLDCEHAIILWYIDMKNKKENKTTTMEFDIDGWWSKELPGQDIMMAYYKNWAKKMGIDAPNSMDAMAGMLAAYKVDMTKVAEKMKDLGSPVEATYVMYTMDEETWAKQKVQIEQQNKEKAEAQAKKDKEEESSSSSGGFGGLFGGITKSITKSVTPKSESKPTPTERPSAMKFTVSTLVQKIVDAAPGRYDIPAGYEKD
jgi:hypothetical protein